MVERPFQGLIVELTGWPVTIGPTALELITTDPDDIHHLDPAVDPIGL